MSGRMVNKSVINVENRIMSPIRQAEEGYNSEGGNETLKKIARDNKERQLRQQERNAAMIQKVEQMSLEQQKKVAETREKLEEEKRRKLEEQHKKRLDDRIEIQNRNQKQNQELGQLKKKIPLYLQKEQQYAEQLNQIE